MTIDRKQVERIAEKVMEGLAAAGQSASTSNPAPSGSGGVFQEMEDAIQAAIVAHQELVRLPLATREKLIQTLRGVGWANREEYGRMELEETDLGAVDGTVLKIETACGVPGMEDIASEVFMGDRGVTINERLPVGVIASINAITNAAPGIIHNGIMMLAGGNTVVHNPHPKTKIVSARVINDIDAAIVAAGGPANCMTTVAEPDIPTAQYLMTHPQIDLISVTGGHRVVEFATKTGKRVIAGGPGNPPVVVDETADLDHAAQCIIRGASFSHCTPCSSEKEIFVVDSVADKLKSLLVESGAFELSKAQGEALVKEIFKEIRSGRTPGTINMDYIGKPPHVILKRAIGLDVAPETKIAILETDKEHPLIWTEQIMPILPFVRCRDAKEAMTMGVAAEQGLRHTIVFHSNSLNNLAYMSSIADASQFVKNASSIGGLGVEGEGFKSLHIATGGEGLVRPRVYTLIRRCVLTDDFRYRIGIVSAQAKP
ncbi:MAG: aldehyde dehydrogenase [Deltaproteobacteria bacterium]|jgi:propionaldehyde dehydrogenase|nr:aldehyde dehydrogenase [Deltaproteobacteria bacterium]